MKITYYFVNGEKSEVEVSDEIGAYISAEERINESYERGMRRHCYMYNELDISDNNAFILKDPINLEDMFETKLENNKLNSFLNQLTETQMRRILMFSDGLNTYDIAKIENVSHQKVHKSISQIRKKYKKFLKKGC